jgi:hypothetical protein
MIEYKVGGSETTMLTQMLKESQTFSSLSIPEQQITMVLASKFQDSINYLFLNPEELALHTGIGTKEQWYDFLLLQETKNFIKSQMAFMSQIAQRKTFASLVQLALDGNQQAAKQVQELSGVLNQQDTNRTIVLHQIPRPPKEVVT